MQYLCIRFRAKIQCGGMKKEFFERFTQTEVVQEASAYIRYRYLGNKEQTVNYDIEKVLLT